MVVFAPCGSFLALLVLCLNFHEFSDDASASRAVMPSRLRPHPESQALSTQLKTILFIVMAGLVPAIHVFLV
jgi:hypothetical protein